MRSAERSSQSPRMEESLGWARRKEVFAWGPWQWVTRGARRADRVSPPWHVSHVSSLVSWHVSWFKYANKIITSPSSVSLSIISDGPFVHFLVSVALMIKKCFKSFLLCQDYDIFIKFLEQGRRSHYPRIILSSVNISGVSVSASLSRCVFCVDCRCQV